MAAPEVFNDEGTPIVLAHLVASCCVDVAEHAIPAINEPFSVVQDIVAVAIAPTYKTTSDVLVASLVQMSQAPALRCNTTPTAGSSAWPLSPAQPPPHARTFLLSLG